MTVSLWLVGFNDFCFNLTLRDVQFSPVPGRQRHACVFFESIGRKATRLAIAVVGILLVLPAAAQTPIDGDSLRVDGATYRLYGIDAPDRSQICTDGWPAGYEAQEYLGQLIEGKEVVCVPIVGRRNGETVAICRADGVDLGGAMVTAGRAFAFVPYSARYIAQEDAAASAGRGVHAHDCVAPWVWRRRLARPH